MAIKEPPATACPIHGFLFADERASEAFRAVMAHDACLRHFDPDQRELLWECGGSQVRIRQNCPSFKISEDATTEALMLLHKALGSAYDVIRQLISCGSLTLRERFGSSRSRSENFSCEILPLEVPPFGTDFWLYGDVDIVRRKRVFSLHLIAADPTKRKRGPGKPRTIEAEEVIAFGVLLLEQKGQPEPGQPKWDAMARVKERLLAKAEKLGLTPSDSTAKLWAKAALKEYLKEGSYSR